MIHIPHFVQLNWNVGVDLPIVRAIEFFSGTLCQSKYSTKLEFSYNFIGPLTLFTCVGQIVTTIRLKYNSLV